MAQTGTALTNHLREAGEARRSDFKEGPWIILPGARDPASVLSLQPQGKSRTGGCPLARDPLRALQPTEARRGSPPRDAPCVPFITFSYGKAGVL